jgi:hypothetical protein
LTPPNFEAQSVFTFTAVGSCPGPRAVRVGMLDEGFVVTAFVVLWWLL